MKTKKHKLSYKKSTKHNAISKTRVNKIQRSQRAGGAKISNVIVIYQYFKTFETEESILDYNPELDFQLYVNSEYCNTDILLGFDIFYIPIPISPPTKDNKPEFAYTNKKIQTKVVEFIKSLPEFEVINNDLRCVYYIKSLYNEYNFYNENNTGEMILNALFDFKKEEENYWKDKLDIYMHYTVKDKFENAYKNNINGFNGYIKTLQSQTHKLLFLLPLLPAKSQRKNNDRKHLFPRSHLHMTNIDVPYLNILNMDIDDEIKESDFTCTKWFLYFLETMTKCGSNRLMQFSGTCYLNAVINSLLLGEGMKSLILKRFLSRLQELKIIGFTFKNLIKDINRNLEDTYKCSIQIVHSIFNIIYQIFVKNHKFGKPREGRGRNIIAPIVHNSRASFNVNFVKGYSNTTDALTKIFSRIFYKPGNILDIKLNTNTFIQNSPSKFSIPERLLSQHNEFIFIYGNIRFNIPRQNNFTYTIPLNITSNDINYKLDSARITIKPRTGIPHVVLGFICNDIPKIFDSNGFLFTLDWITMLSIIDDKDSKIEQQTKIRSVFIEYLMPLYNYDYIDNIVLDSLIYVNTNEIITEPQKLQEIITNIDSFVSAVDNSK